MKKNRLKKCIEAIEYGITYDRNTGKIFGKSGKELTGKLNGYITIHNRKIKHLFAHHFAWFCVYGNVDFDMLDHKNQDKTDNRICNLRIATPQINQHNRLKTTKGFYYRKERNKYFVSIKINNKTIYGGSFLTEKEARKKYIELKKKYHYD
jgi:hypothetical protein